MPTLEEIRNGLYGMFGPPAGYQPRQPGQWKPPTPSLPLQTFSQARQQGMFSTNVPSAGPKPTAEQRNLPQVFAKPAPKEPASYLPMDYFAPIEQSALSGGFSPMPNPAVEGMYSKSTTLTPGTPDYLNAVRGQVPQGTSLMAAGGTQPMYQRNYMTPQGTASGVSSVPPGQGSFNTLGLGSGDLGQTVEALNRKTDALRSLREAQNPGITQGGMGGYEPPAPPSLQDSISSAYGGARNADFLFRTDMAGKGAKKKQGIMAGILADYQGKQQSYNEQLGLAGKQQETNFEMQKLAAQRGLDWEKLSLEQRKQFMAEQNLPFQQNLMQAQAAGALPKPQEMIAAKYIQAYNAGKMEEAKKYLEQLTELAKTGQKPEDNVQAILAKVAATQPTQ